MSNRVQITGNLATDIVERKSAKGTMYTFNVVDNGFYKPQYFPIVCYDKEVIDKLGDTRKGQSLVILGVLRNNTYTDKNNVTHYIVNIVADTVEHSVDTRKE